MVYTEIVLFEWDHEKARRNALKHGVDFKTAAFAFDDPCAFIVEDAKHSTREARRWLIGDSGARVVVVVHTIRHPERAIRIISARPASRRERRLYEEKKRV